MNRALAAEIRELVAEDLAGAEATGLTGDHRREFARQQIFAHLDRLSHRGSAAVDGDLLAPCVGRRAHPTASGPLGGSPSHELPADPAEERLLAQAVLDALFGIGRLQALIDDPDIENIDINGYDRVWATFADGSKRLMPAIADSDDEVVEMVRAAASRFGLAERRFDLARPEVDSDFPMGAGSRP